jgi:hypothetical protein
LLNKLSVQLAPDLTYIYQKSITAGEVPEDWKMAHVVPIFKKGDKSKSSNYRPVNKLFTILQEASNPAEGVVPDSIVMQFVDEAFMGDLIFGLGKVQENDVDCLH